MRVVEHIRKMMASGSICRDYMRKVEAADGSIRSLYKVFSDVNGLQWFLEQHSQRELTASDIEEFKPYMGVKSGVVEKYPEGYTTRVYACIDEPMDVKLNETITAFIECRNIRCIVNGHGVIRKVYLSRNSDIVVEVGKDAKVEIEAYADADVEVVGDGEYEIRRKV